MMWMLPHRAIYMDGRARPSAYAQHSWQGFSTGEWDGDMLKVTTTHLKEGWLRRNGVPRSEKATLIEYFIRHGEYLTLVTIVKDPVYLTEPFVRTSNWVTDAGFQLSPFSCIPTVEIERARDRNVGAALADGDNQLHLEMQIRGLRRIGNGRAAVDHGIGRFHEEERRLAIGILAHLAGMGGIIATHAEDAPYRKAVRTSCHRDRGLRFHLAVFGIHSATISPPGSGEGSPRQMKAPQR